MEKFYVTKKKYDWVVRYNGEDHDLTRDRDQAIASARARAKAVLEAGGEAEVLAANVVGMWDQIPITE